MGCGSEGAAVGEACVAMRRRGIDGRLGTALREGERLGTGLRAGRLGGLLSAGARKSRYSGRGAVVDGRLYGRDWALDGRAWALKDGFEARTVAVRDARRHRVHRAGAGAMGGEDVVSSVECRSECRYAMTAKVEAALGGGQLSGARR